LNEKIKHFLVENPDFKDRKEWSLGIHRFVSNYLDFTTCTSLIALLCTLRSKKINVTNIIKMKKTKKRTGNLRLECV